ncbi:MAG TPA: recombinase RecT [Aquirhabdus sp.]
MSNQIITVQINQIAAVLGLNDVDPMELKHTLINSVFKGANDTQLQTLLILANQYKLNPFTKEIYAFPSKGSIVPVVGVDGWNRIINSNENLDGIQFEEYDDRCTCIIYRKDRAHPTKVTEFLSECLMNTEPWKKYPKRMLRHKALIQCARVAFGFAGIYDQDEAERIDGGSPSVVDVTPTLPEGYEAFENDHLGNMRAVAMQGTAALSEAFRLLPTGKCKTHFWTTHATSFKECAQRADAQPQGETYEHVAAE